MLLAAPVIIVAVLVLVVSMMSGSGSMADSSSRPSADALADIPADYLQLYQTAAATCPGLDWSVLAGIGKVETNHGRLQAAGVTDGENFAGAGGPMQFLEPTFTWVLAKAAEVGKHIPPGGATPPSRYNAHDAIYAAAFYLCMSGADRGDLYRAIFAYNHADWYVRKVLDQALRYQQAATAAHPAGTWVIPVVGRCTSGFGPRSGEHHNGQDIAAPIGTTIRAAAAGTVISSGPASGYGLWVRIRHDDRTVTIYGHNHRNLVSVGQAVQAGQPIGEVGNRGESTGPHLHFQIEVDGAPVDPATKYVQYGLC